MLPISADPTNFIDATGLSQILIGTDGNDRFKTFYGKVGSSESWMYGGFGDDTYIVLSSKDRVIENADEGIDTVRSDWFFALPKNVENLVLTGSLSVGATGNALDNIIIGNSGNNIIDGGLGADELTGGAGNDMFVLNGDDIVVDFQAGDYFDLRDATGITSFSQVAAGMLQDGSDVLLSLGSAGTVRIRNATVAQFDQGDFLLSTNLSQYKLTFSDEFDTISLNTGTGSDGTWYPLFSRTGLAAHTTPDHGSVQYFTYPDDTGTYGQPIGMNPFSIQDGILTITMDKVARSEQYKIYGYDYTSGMINSLATFSQTYGYFEIKAKLPVGQGLHDAFWLLGADGTWPPELDIVEQKGNDPNNVITVAHATSNGQRISHAKIYNVPTASTEFHTYGLDWEPDFLTWYIDGVAVRTQPTWPGMDVPMYLIASLGGGGPWAGDPDATTPFPAQFQIDYIRVYASEHTVEKGVPVDKVGTDGADKIYGTSLGDRLNGGLGDDRLYGLAGNDTLIGGGGNDLLDGGFGDDRYVIVSGTEKIGEGGNNGIDTVETALSSYTLGINVENLVYTGTGYFTGTGNGEDNVIAGGNGGNTLNGGAGNDTIYGGVLGDQVNAGDGNDTVDGRAGNDTIRGNAGDDSLFGGEGEDLIKGDDGNDQIFGGLGLDNLQGNAGNDIIDGGIGKDRMVGGNGDDTYIVDTTADTITELLNEGTDTIRTALSSYTLGANLENLEYTGTGSIVGTGNELDNLLKGGAGQDFLTGLGGNDTYIINSTGDQVIEADNGGIDTIRTDLTTYKLSTNLENLAYTGNRAFTGTGNSAANAISGGALNDRLDGQAGADTLAGLAGNDTYVVDNINDVVLENPGEGLDRILAKVTFTASDNVETIQLSTSKSINATGNALANTLVGNGGANVLDGRAGADVLTGGGGNDVFQFRLGEGQADVVKDFSGAGAFGGDLLRFVGYGADAQLIQIGNSDFYEIHAGIDGGGSIETIQVVGVTNLAAQDFVFI
ncbi:family 16 glycosylhydrolase [Novosphingobium cyanobacteriorum]|uniref:Family 16 glycosylhydrolase n=1 Tax=Novosphingobium cyanobacteriorum TaxID=3024215 RepID=A0ABT6CP51_9SPHN|nr:family 16 glycosylhydrolase [Novosphingobium cyanobacteriorum]MDF8335013.1 family 16 glycosylhydrolase [Novosphingobium cyanobacteriorum]